jgi:putative membrane protein
MVKDHTEGVEKFKKEASEGQDPDLKAYAAKLTPILEEHLRMARTIANQERAPAHQ